MSWLLAAVLLCADPVPGGGPVLQVKPMPLQVEPMPLRVEPMPLQVKPRDLAAEPSLPRNMAEVASLSNGQGEMAGEVTSGSVLLQTRLTQGTRLVERDLPGAEGVALFRYATTAAGLTDPECKTTRLIHARPEHDFIVRARVTNLKPGTRYYYQVVYGGPVTAAARQPLATGPVRTFRTLPSRFRSVPVDFTVIACMNYARFHHDPRTPGTPVLTHEQAADRVPGYPALVAIAKQNPDFVIATGDNVYYDTPVEGRAKTQTELRQKWHEQFSQGRFIDLFGQTATFWEKDDHDFRYDDADNSNPHIKPSPELGRKTFLEQVPIGPQKQTPLTYRTIRVGKDLQLWLVEGRDYRSPNGLEDGPEKTLWGFEQYLWLTQTLAASDATFKLIISPTPMVGPDDARKHDNGSNIGGFRHERDRFFDWLVESGTLQSNTYLICGDRHWQYHSVDPRGIEEFGCGALCDENSRTGRAPGDPKSTDPDATIAQPYLQKDPSGGFLRVQIVPAADANPPTLTLRYYNDVGEQLHEVVKPGR